MLDMLRTDLGITTNKYDVRLYKLIESAQKMIETEGITIDDTNPQDQQLVVSYAAWMWRRRDTMEGMPRMLRWQLNNRLMSQKMKETE